jgi:transglutaminase-like putative cysteine protease
VIYVLRHKTTYAYESPVTFARCVLRLTPRSSKVQSVRESSVMIAPAPSHRSRRTGPFGEEVLTVVVETPHRELVIEARSVVDVHAGAIAASPSPPWEEVRARGYGSAGLGPEDPAAYLYPTARTPVIPAVTGFARASFVPGREIVEAGADLMTRMYSDFVYDGDATDVSTPAAEAFEARRGVCQDFAHIMICGLRGLGLPAAYVSGYLRTRPPPGRARLQGADATHAWISLWCGEETGWISLDPTNALIVGDDHIVLAIGRDYSDVAPIDGILLAPGDQSLKVEVDVTPREEAGPRPAPLRDKSADRLGS